MGTKKNKTDNGFQLLYYRLSYRRRFIRTLWLLPFGMILIIFLMTNPEIIFKNRLIQNVIIPMLLVVGNIGQLTYNYTKWKKQGREDKVI